MFSARQGVALGLIVVLHVAFFYALQAGLMRKASRFVEEEVVGKLIMPEAPPEPPPPPPPKVVETPPPPPPPTRQILKPVDAPPPPTAITLEKPPEDPRPPEPQPVVVSAAPPTPAPPPVVAPPAPPPPQPAVKSLGDAGIEYVKAPALAYPPISLRLRETGDLLLRVLVDEQGRVDRVEVQKSSGYTRLDNAAKEAAARAVFKPYFEGGRAVTVWVVVPFSFKLDS